MPYAMVQEARPPIVITETSPLSARIAAAYQAGGSLRHVGDGFGVNEAAVRKALAEHDVPVRPLPRLKHQYSLTGLEKQILARGRRGESLRQIGDSLGVGHEVVRKLLRRNGVGPNVKARPEVRPTPGRLAWMIVQYTEKHATILEISEAVGHSTKWVSKYLERAGVRVAPGPRRRYQEHQRYEQIANRVREGATRAEMREEFGISSVTVSRALRVHGVRSTYYVSPEQVAAVREHFQEHRSTRAAAEHAGTSVGAAQRILREAKTPGFARRTRWSVADRQRAVEHYQAHGSSEDAAALIGASGASVYRWARAASKGATLAT